jgi:hypothetical protein
LVALRSRHLGLEPARRAGTPTGEFLGTYKTSAGNNVYTYWCECLRQSADCYKANNHVQSLLQIIDDDRQLQGWVGVETSTHVNPSTLEPDQDFAHAYWAVLNMVTPDLRGPQPS